MKDKYVICVKKVSGLICWKHVLYIAIIANCVFGASGSKLLVVSKQKTGYIKI